MTLPTSGPLSLTDIQTEFGGSNPISLNEYYAGGSYVPSGTTGTYGAVPTSGQISIQNFYGTSNYYSYSKSLRFRSSASAYMNRTPSGGNQKTWTWSGWVKRSNLGQVHLLDATSSASVETAIRFRGTDTLQVFYINSTYVFNVSTAALYRDPSAWYHIVVAFDTTQATASNRLKLYVNGSLITSFTDTSYPAQNTNYPINSNIVHNIGRSTQGSSYLDGYLTGVYFIDGQALDASYFGATNATTGVWQPKAYGGTYGTTGYFLPFTNVTSTATLGYDSSGLGNNWTTNNFSLTTGVTYDSMLDVPTWTSTASNYAVLNLLDKYSSLVVNDGNLKLLNNGGGGTWWSTNSTIWVSSGKWYWESTIGGSQYSVVGVSGPNQPISTNDRWVGYTSDSYGYYGANGNKVNNNTSTAYGASYTAGDVIGVALDMDSGTITFYKNNVSQGTAYSGLSGLKTPGFSVNDQGTDPYQNVNFGQQGFKYTPPTGFIALNAYNLTAAAIVKSNQYMDAVLYTGNGTTQSITNGGSFQPAFNWAKITTSSYSHCLQDINRGTSVILRTNQTAADQSVANAVTAFNSNGVTYGGYSDTNNNGSTFVAWQWVGGGNPVSNTSGSLTSSVSANTTSKFSVVTWTSSASYPQTIGHGLSAVPKMIIVKNRQRATDWGVYHVVLGNTKALLMNSTSGPVSDVGFWNNTTPTSSVFTTGNGRGYTTGGIAENFVAYCFSDVVGFSKFDTYTGNGSSDGTFVYCGFKPRYIMIKRYDTSGNSWSVFDTARSPYNISNGTLRPDSDISQVSADFGDFLSNGFKLRGTNSDWNTNGATYLYAAFASNPFNYALAQ